MSTLPFGYVQENSTPQAPPGYQVETPRVVLGGFSDPGKVNGPDPYLTAQTQLALERGPWAVRKHLPIGQIRVYEGNPTESSNFIDAANPVAGVKEGATRNIDVYNPGVYAGQNEGEYANHEATHLIQNEETPEEQAQIPALGSYKSQYSDYSLTPAQLVALRAQGDTLRSHTREGQASIIQKYEDKMDWLRAKATPAQRDDFMNSQGEFKGNGYAEWMAAYEPYLDDLEDMKLPGDKQMPPTQIQSTAVIPPAGYTVDR